MTAQPETRSLTITVSDAVFAGLVEKGRKAGYTPTLYAKLLFEAGYAARVGKGEGDPVLAACVEKSVGRATAPQVASKASPATPPTPVVQIVAQPVLVPVVVPIAVPVTVEVAVADAPPVAVPETREEPEARPEPEPDAVTAGFENWSVSQTTFARLVCREEGVSLREAKIALMPAYQSTGSLKVLVGVVRRLLRAHGIEVEAVEAWGWRVERHCRTAADALLGRIA